VKFNKEVVRLINQEYSMKELLAQMGVEVHRSMSIFCPFHPNTETKSAKYFEEDNSVYCWGEGRSYRPLDVLRILGIPDEKIIMGLSAAGKLTAENLAAKKEKKDQPVFKNEARAQALKKEYIKGRIDPIEYTKELLTLLS